MNESEIKTTLNLTFFIRFLLVGGLFIGFAFLAIYDGTVKYPKLKAQHDQYTAWLDEQPDQGVSLELAWIEYAKSQGLPTDIKTIVKRKKTDSDINTQFILAVVSFVIGALLWLTLLTAWRMRVTFKDGVIFAKGVQIAFEDIVLVENDLWKKKGIAWLKNAEGQRILLDAWKFTPEAITTIYERVLELEPEQTASQEVHPNDAEASEEQPSDNKEENGA